MTPTNVIVEKIMKKEIFSLGRLELFFFDFSPFFRLFSIFPS